MSAAVALMLEGMPLGCLLFRTADPYRIFTGKDGIT